MIRYLSFLSFFLIYSTFSYADGYAQLDNIDAVQKLVQGNKNFIAGKNEHCAATTADLREQLAGKQQPFAVILSCSDSRLPPEIIFDKSLGELFVVRVAGNTPDKIALGSIEYAIEHLGAGLIVVLGHERCGAVTATIDANGHAEGNIGSIVKAIAPAVTTAKKEGKGLSKPELVELAVDKNTELVASLLPKQSSIIKHMLKEGKIKIITAKYDLDEGKVRFNQ